MSLPCSVLHRIAFPVVSEWCQLEADRFTTLLARGRPVKLVQHLLVHASTQLTLDRYTLWIPGMGAYTASAMDEALG